jgi:hypothetical protein
MNRWKMIFGFLLLTSLIGLAAAIAIGRVEESTSHGLREIIAIIGTLSGAFCGWAFGSQSEKEDK